MSTSAYQLLRQTISKRIKTLDLDPIDDVESIRQLIDSEVRRYQAHANLGVGVFPPLADARAMFGRLDDSFLGYGILTEMLDDPDVEEIFVEGSDVYCLDGSGTLRSSSEVVSSMHSSAA